MKNVKIFSAIFAMVLMSMQVWAQSNPPAGAKYITVNIANSELRLNFVGSTANTDVWVETSPGIFEHKTIGTIWCGFQTYTITDGVAKVYGDIAWFDCGCSLNLNNEVTNLDFSNNTLLTKLSCGYNQLTTLDVSALNNLTQLSCSDNQLTTLDVSGLSNLNRFACYNNQLTTLDVSGLSNLTNLKCDNNQLTTLDVSTASNLNVLDCYYNQLTTLDVSALSNLNYLGCFDNQLTTLDVSGLSNLAWLSCSNNQLTTLDVSDLNNLIALGCYNNQLSNLDVSGLSNLNYLECCNNNFNTQAIDDIYCALPERTVGDEGSLYIANNTGDANHDDILVSNATNARNKNWNVWYLDDYSGSLHDTDVPTTGSYVCGSAAVEDIENAQFSIYPNPANELLNIEIAPQMLGSDITIYDQTGRKIISKKANAQTNVIDISNLYSGVYVIKIDSKAMKLLIN